MRLNKTLVLLFFQFVFIYLSAENARPIYNPDSLDNLKTIKEADRIISKNFPDYKSALNLYLKVFPSNQNEAALNFKIGICYLATVEKTKAISYLEKASKLDYSINPGINFLLGKAYHLNYEFDKAINIYDKYINSLSDEVFFKYPELNDIFRLFIYKIENKDFSRENMKNLAEKKIQECETAKELIRNSPVGVKIRNLGPSINTLYPEYGPVIKADESEMYFTSRRENTTGGKTDPQDGQYYEDIYISYNVNGNWTEAIKMGPPINNDLHNAVLGLSVDGQTLFIYDGSGDIFSCRLLGDKWSEPVKLDKIINTLNPERSICLSADEKRLFFERDDAKDGYGGRDIYVSEKNASGEWKRPQNLGQVINTEYDEDGVFFHPDGKTLYFSSTGHNNMGGYDIFKSEYEDGEWSEPINIGYPINTPDDDIFFVLSADGQRGYYSSVKSDSYGDKDIYEITMPQLKPGEHTAPEAVTLLAGVITDSEDKTPLAARIQITDNTKNQIIAELASNSKTGKYLVVLPPGINYGITILKDNYLFHSENFNIPVSQGFQKITKNIELQKISSGRKVILNNVFFNYDESILRPESKAELNTIVDFLKSFPSGIIEISGHTDSIGSNEYNQILSEERAKAVVNYLANKGISKKRFFFVGYGETEPIASNSTEGGRQLNRRTELKIRELNSYPNKKKK